MCKSQEVITKGFYIQIVKDGNADFFGENIFDNEIKFFIDLSNPEKKKK